jgi:hypothetical protein
MTKSDLVKVSGVSQIAVTGNLFDDNVGVIDCIDMNFIFHDWP